MTSISKYQESSEIRTGTNKFSFYYGVTKNTPTEKRNIWKAIVTKNIYTKTNFQIELK